MSRELSEFTSLESPAASIARSGPCEPTLDETMSDSFDVEEVPQSPARSRNSSLDRQSKPSGLGDASDKSSNRDAAEESDNEGEDKDDAASESDGSFATESSDDEENFSYEEELDGSGSSVASEAQWGHEPFDILKPKVGQLCKNFADLLGQPSSIDNMKGGGFNRVVGLKFAPSNAEFVLRIPRLIYDEDEAHEIKDQVDVQMYLGNYDFLRVPTIAAYDTTMKNDIAARYVLMQRVPGIPIQDVFYDLPLSEKLQITSIVADLCIKMESIKFAKPGRLVGPRTLPEVSHTAPSRPATIEITGYRGDPMVEAPSLENQNLSSMIYKLLQWRKEQIEDWPQLAKKCDRLMEIVKEMEATGFMRSTDNDCVLWHWDLSASNILIERSGASIDMPKVEASEAVSANIELACEHTVESKADDTAARGFKYSIQFRLEHESGTDCKRSVEVAIKDASGKTYLHTFEIMDNKHKYDDSQTAIASTAIPTNFSQATNNDNTHTPAKRKWVISSVLDWDDVLSVPLILARKPPSWLWRNEEKLKRGWSGNRDAPLQRDLTQDELLIKAHFDQIMTCANRNHVDDAYHRGPWLRALARFALEDLTDSEGLRRAKRFIRQ